MFLEIQIASSGVSGPLKKAHLKINADNNRELAYAA